jgi:hypothetical protein
VLHGIQAKKSTKVLKLRSKFNREHNPGDDCRCGSWWNEFSRLFRRMSEKGLQDLKSAGAHCTSPKARKPRRSLNARVGHRVVFSRTSSIWNGLSCASEVRLQRKNEHQFSLVFGKVSGETCFGCCATSVLIPATITETGVVSRQKFCAECLAQFRKQFKQQISTREVEIEIDFRTVDVSRALNELGGRISSL